MAEPRGKRCSPNLEVSGIPFPSVATLDNRFVEEQIAHGLVILPDITDLQCEQPAIMYCKVAIKGGGYFANLIRRRPRYLGNYLKVRS